MPYASQAGMELIWGVTNISKWADIDNDANAGKKAARIARAVLVADGQVDDVARHAQYLIPLQDSSGSTPITVEDTANKLAGLWLYEGPGCQDWDKKSGMPYHRLGYIAMLARRWLADVQTNQIKLDAVIGA